MSIPTLFPHLEGIAIEAFRPGGKSKESGPQQAILDAFGAHRDAADDAVVATVTLLWTPLEFTNFATNSRLLNRHVVLHGRSLGYGTAANSAQVLYALDHLHSLVKVAGATRAKPTQ